MISESKKVRIREMHRLKAKANREKLSDGYVRQLAKNQGWTKEMIQAEPDVIGVIRASVKLKRYIWQNTSSTVERN